jgi:hypothetical protein
MNTYRLNRLMVGTHASAEGTTNGGATAPDQRGASQ